MDEIEVLFQKLAKQECNLILVAYHPRRKLRFAVRDEDSETAANGATLEDALGQLLDHVALDRANDELLQKDYEIRLQEGQAVLCKWTEEGLKRLGAYPSWQEAQRSAR